MIIQGWDFASEQLLEEAKNESNRMKCNYEIKYYKECYKELSKYITGVY